MTGRDPGSWLLAAGALVGVGLAAVGLGDGGAPSRVPPGAVAVVDGAVIAEADYRRAVAAVAADRREGVDAGLRRRVLERLIDEELLVQRGIELQLAERDPRVRNYLSAAVIDLIVARADDAIAEPSELELRALYAADPRFFAASDQWRVGVARFDSAAAARAARRRLAGGARFAELGAEAAPPPVPDARLPAATLREYLGPAVVDAIAELRAGDVSAPIASPAGHLLIQVVEHVPGTPPPFEQVRAQVRGEYRRRAGDEHLRAFLAERRRAAAIVVAEERL